LKNITLKNKFLQSFIILSGSNLLAQAINLITYFILPKYFYSPSEFGVFGLYLPVYFILFEIINLKMDQSIMLPKKDEEAKQLVAFSWLIAAVFAFSLSIIISLVSFLVIPLDKHLVYFLAFSLLVGGALQPILVWLNRQKQYFQMGNIRVVQAIATLGGSIFFYFKGIQGFNGLILGFVCGQIIAILTACFYIPTSGWSLANKTLIKQYKQFIQFGSLSSMVSTLSRNLPAFAIKFFFSDIVLGWYTIASKYLNAPIGIFATSLGQVYFKEAAIAQQPRLKNLTAQIIRNIFLLVVIPSFVILFFGENLFGWALGVEWKQAGNIAQVLILWYMVAYISGPLSILIDVKMKLKWELKYNVIMLIARAAALASAFFINDVLVVLGIFAFVGLVFNCILLFYIWTLSQEDAS
jgi:O-antigen/teichoic acid export membrane protein